MSWKTHISYLVVIGLIITYYQMCTKKYSAHTVTTISNVSVKSKSNDTAKLVRIDSSGPLTLFANHSHIPENNNHIFWKKIFTAKPQLIHDTISIATKIDTPEIIKLYFARYYYSDVFKTKYGTGKIIDTISENQIKGRSVLIDENIPIERKTTVVTPQPSLKLFAGPSIGTGLGAGLSLLTRKENLYSMDLFWNFRGMNLLISKKWIIKFGK